MPKMTLLEIVQSILSDIDGSEVNSISDTVESEQIASIVRDTFYDLTTNKDTPEHEKLVQFEGLSDITKPNYLKVPVNVEKFKVLRYNVSESGDTDYRILKFTPPENFLDRTLAQDSSDANVEKVNDFSGIPLLIRNDRMPTYYTMFDDEHVVCDSYLKTIDTTLQQSKTISLAKVSPSFSISDSFVPDIDVNQFPLLLQESKAMAFALHKQTSVPKLEKRIRKNKQRLINDLNRNKQPYTGPDYGRK